MWGDSIVEFGSYHYRYASGREGEWMLVGFSPRKQNLTLDITLGFDEYDSLLAQIGKHRPANRAFTSRSWRTSTFRFCGNWSGARWLTCLAPADSELALAVGGQAVNLLGQCWPALGGEPLRGCRAECLRFQRWNRVRRLAHGLGAGGRGGFGGIDFRAGRAALFAVVLCRMKLLGIMDISTITDPDGVYQEGG